MEIIDQGIDNSGVYVVRVVPFRTTDRFGAEVEVHYYEDGDAHGLKVKKNGETYAVGCYLPYVAKFDADSAVKVGE